MATTFAPITKVDDALEAARENVAAFGATVWGRAFMHLVHVAFFITFVVKRHHTVLPILGWLQHQAGTAVYGIPASLLHVAAESFDGLWTLALKPFGI